MTNAEKYKEVFGFEHPDCPTWHCPSCPIFKECLEHHFSEIAHQWWNSEYKERRLIMTSPIINITKEEIANKMFFTREENSDQPIAVVKVADLLEKEVKNNENR